MNLKMLKVHILVFILLILSIISINDVSAEGCCALISQQCGAITPGFPCTDPTQGLIINPTQSCGSLPPPNPCLPGCCCIDNGYVSILEKWCTHWYLEHDFFHIPLGTPDPDQYCQSNCNGQLQTRSVSGNVHDEQGIVVNGAIVTIDTQTYTTGSGGYFNFPRVPVGQRTITAVKDGCDDSQTFMLTEDKNDVVLTLQCCGEECEDWTQCVDNSQTRNCENTCTGNTYTQTQACYPGLCTWVCTDWTPEDCEYGTQQIRNCENVSLPPGCSIWPASPPESRSCPSSSQCGNLVKEPGEQCDYNYATGQGDNPCPPTYLCDGCICKPPQGGCYDNHPATQLLPLEPNGHVPNERKIFVQWDQSNLECDEYIEKYMLWGWKNQTPILNRYLIDNNIPKTDESLMVISGAPMTLEQNAEYCFVLTTVFNDEIGSPHVNSSVECITIGEDYCLNGGRTMCGISNSDLATAFKCLPNNKVKQAIILIGGNEEEECEDEKQFCRISNNIGYCVQVSDCDACNWFFGGFGYQGFGFSYRDITCPDLEDQKYKAYTSEGLFAGCFLDHTSTAVDMAQSCTKVHSCYDYKSRGACVEDRCESLSIEDVSGCEWVDYSLEFNKGICRPKLELINRPDMPGFKQQCNLCGDPGYNWIYPVCTESVCKLYGECYYTTAGECKDGLGIKCIDYDNVGDCVGNSEYVVNISWNQGFTAAMGDNHRLSMSNDYFGLGVCKWNESLSNKKCFRDADNRPGIGNEPGADCRILNTAARIRCERDVAPPISHINNRSMYGAIMDLKGSLDLSDVPGWPFSDNTTNKVSGDRNTIWLYYCISPTNVLCYPNKILQVDSVFEDQQMTIDLSSLTHLQYYTFSYFTEDPGRNRELVKRFNFRLDKNAPVIEWSKTLTARLNNDNVWVTDVSISIKSLSEDTYPVTCSFSLLPETNPSGWTGGIFDIVDGIIGGNGGTVGTEYIGLASDIYQYELSCSDAVGNIFHELDYMVVDGDARINQAFPHSPKPPYVTANLPDKISIHTINPGTCRYSMNTPLYNEMEGEFTSEGIGPDDYIHHDDLVNVLMSHPEYGASGVYRIYVACELDINGETKIVMGEDSDTITFTVDDLAPLSILYYYDDIIGDYVPYIQGTLRGFMSISLDILGNDSHPILDYYGDDRSFGNNRTYYCKKLRNNEESCTSITEFTLYSPEYHITYDYSDENSIDRFLYGINPKLCYYSIDNGGNKEPIRCTKINARNTIFLPPDIEIIPTGD